MTGEVGAERSPYIGRCKVALGRNQRQFFLFIFYQANHRVKEREKGIAREEKCDKKKLTAVSYKFVFQGSVFW